MRVKIQMTKDTREPMGIGYDPEGFPSETGSDREFNLNMIL